MTADKMPLGLRFVKHEGLLLPEQRKLNIVGGGYIPKDANGRTELSGDRRRIDVTLTAQQSYYATTNYWGGTQAQLSGFLDADDVFVSATVTGAILGGLAPTTTNLRKNIINVGPNTFVLSSSNASANIVRPGGVAITLQLNEGRRIYYDATLAKWLVCNVA